MEFELIGGSLKDVLGDDKSEYHHEVLANNKIWLFSKKYQEQPSYNWGHRVSYAGGYAIAFDLKSKKWEEKIEVPALQEDENGEEFIFELGGEIYLLLRASYHAIEFRNFYRWTGSCWEELSLEAPEKVEQPDNPNSVDAVMALSASESERFVVFRKDYGLSVYKLIVDGGAKIEHVTEVTAEQLDTRFDMPVSAFYDNGKLFVFFAIMGCGMRWEKNQVLQYDFELNEWKNITIPGEWDEMPRFSFLGATSHGIAPSGDWIHAGGRRQLGMTDSKFNGEVWALTDLNGQPKWKKLEFEIPEDNPSALIETHSGNVYVIGDTIATAQPLVIYMPMVVLNS